MYGKRNGEVLSSGKDGCNLKLGRIICAHFTDGEVYEIFLTWFYEVFVTWFYVNSNFMIEGLKKRQRVWVEIWKIWIYKKLKEILIIWLYKYKYMII